jgi:hypothetical protein
VMELEYWVVNTNIQYSNDAALRSWSEGSRYEA